MKWLRQIIEAILIFALCAFILPHSRFIFIVQSVSTLIFIIFVDPIYYIIKANEKIKEDSLKIKYDFWTCLLRFAVISPEIIGFFIFDIFLPYQEPIKVLSIIAFSLVYFAICPLFTRFFRRIICIGKHI